MTQADRIRQFVLDRYVVPAKQEGRAEIVVRAGDVHREMGLVSAMPAVCSAIGSNKFNTLAQITTLERTGPANGANVYFRFGLGVPRREQPLRDPLRQQAPERALAPNRSTPDFHDALVLVSCVKSKLPHAAPARTLYTSPWFRMVRDMVEANGAQWMILSAQHGLISPDAIIAPYDRTLNACGVAERRVWARNVLDDFFGEARGCCRIIIFAGERYREFLIEPLKQKGVEVEIPMANLPIGKQLAWLSEHT